MGREISAWGWSGGHAARIRVAMPSLAATSVFLAAPVRGREHRNQKTKATAESSDAVSLHAAHLTMMPAPSCQVVDADYSVPDVTLHDQDGRAVASRLSSSGDRPVAINVF